MSDVRAREILDCRGLPTLQVDVLVDGALLGRADVPAGRSTGRYEAKELRDGGKRFGGYGVTKAIANVHGEIAKALKGASLNQRAIDETLIDLDHTPDKSRLGANAITGVSMAVSRAIAAAHRSPLFLDLNPGSHILPVPQVNLINGGRHASNDLDFQEFIVMPVGATNFLEAMAISTEVNLVLIEMILAKYGKAAINVGDEGGAAPPISDPEEALELLHRAVERAGYSRDIVYGLDAAATHLYDSATRQYRVAGQARSTDQMIELYEHLVKEWGIVSIEDPLDESDFNGFADLTERLGIQIVGDDLFVTSSARVQQGIDRKAANALLWKFNQVGTLTEALNAADLAVRHGYGIVVSERSGETEDPIIADLTVALNARQIKTGAPVRGERTAKYNRLLLIEEELGSKARYAGAAYRTPPELMPAQA